MMRYFLSIIVVVLFNIVFYPKTASAHCDGIDGPVVLAAKEALKTGNLDLILIWVQESDEAEVKKVFDHTLKVRKLGEEARTLADTFFFETIVRIHRAGEGAPYTGLKPAGRDIGPAIPAADRAVESGSAKKLLKLLSEAVHSGLHKRFMHVLALKDFPVKDVEKGREFVKAYVEFLHYVEPIYEIAIKNPGHGHNEGTQSLEH